MQILTKKNSSSARENKLENEFQTKKARDLYIIIIRLA